jgi:hypothetical protein
MNSPSASDSISNPPLPELQQAQFHAAGLLTLLNDIAACAEITEIILKYSATQNVPEQSTLTLEDGKRLLIDGSARGVQFRYRYQGSDWWDTIMALPQGQFRLVRIQHNFASSNP